MCDEEQKERNKKFVSFLEKYKNDNLTTKC